MNINNVINTNSLHYRFMCRFLDWHQPHTLCAYGWKLLWAATLTFFIAPTTIFGMGFDAYATFAVEGTDEQTAIGVFLSTLEFDSKIIAIWVLLSAMLGVVAWLITIVIAVVFAVAVLCEGGSRVRGAYREARGISAVEPSLIASWWTAHKKKYCPILQYKDES